MATTEIKQCKNGVRNTDYYENLWVNSVSIQPSWHIETNFVVNAEKISSFGVEENII